jgi:hypothetical protein
MFKATIFLTATILALSSPTLAAGKGGGGGGGQNATKPQPTIGSATSGAGAGKIKFNEFTIKKTTDKASPNFYQNSVSGTHYKQ